MSEINCRKRGDKWEYRFEGARINNKRTQITKGGFRTKKDALEAGTKALAEYNNAGFHFTPSELSFSDYLDYWMKEYCLNNLKNTTLENYEKKIRLHIKPVLGRYKLKALTPAVLQSFINQKFNEGYSKNTLCVLKGLLSGCLGYAVEPSAFIQTNPMLMVRLPSPRATAQMPTRRKNKEIITQEMWQAIIQRFPSGHSCHIPLQLGYRCGCRLGETFALTWEDIDFDKGTLDINKQVQMTDGAWTFQPPKYNSRRIIRLDSGLLNILKEEKEKQIKARYYYAEQYEQQYLNEYNQITNSISGTKLNLICVRECGSYTQPRIMQHCSRIIHYQLGYPAFDYHSLRHTHATMLLEAGANPKDVQTRLGHKNISVTLEIYTHCTNKMQEETVNILNSLML